MPNLGSVYIIGLFLGMAGASFAVALPLASCWYPPQYQGLVLGIVGAGNSGTVLTALFAPKLADIFGWQAVLGLAAIPMVITLIVYTCCAKDAPKQEGVGQQKFYLYVFKEQDTWWFCLFYFVTFGGFVGLASSLVIYFNDEYSMSPVSAGNYTAICVFIGSMFRPLGGALADRIGGVRVLLVLYIVVASSLFSMGLDLTSFSMVLFVFLIGMSALGMGNGAIFQLVSLRFRKEIGTIAGIVGTAGGIGGFCLASFLGFSKEWTGGYQSGFISFAGFAIFCLAGIFIIKSRWRTSWPTRSSCATRSRSSARACARTPWPSSRPPLMRQTR